MSPPNPATPALQLLQGRGSPFEYTNSWGMAERQREYAFNVPGGRESGLQVPLRRGGRSVAAVRRTMMSPVVRRLVPIQGRPPGHWSRVWLHDTRVLPSFAQLRCRGASCEGCAVNLHGRVHSRNSLETHRTLISSAGASMLVARASCCSCHRCCILTSAHSPTAAGVHVTTGSRTRTGTTGLVPSNLRKRSGNAREMHAQGAPRHFCAATQCGAASDFYAISKLTKSEARKPVHPLHPSTPRAPPNAAKTVRSCAPKC